MFMFGFLCLVLNIENNIVVLFSIRYKIFFNEVRFEWKCRVIKVNYKYEFFF